MSVPTYVLWYNPSSGIVQVCSGNNTDVLDIPDWLADAAQNNYHDAAIISGLMKNKTTTTTNNSMIHTTTHASDEDTSEEGNDSCSETDVASDESEPPYTKSLMNDDGILQVPALHSQQHGAKSSLDEIKNDAQVPRRDFVARSSLCLHCRGPSNCLCPNCNGAYFCSEPRTCRQNG